MLSELQAAERRIRQEAMIAEIIELAGGSGSFGLIRRQEGKVLASTTSRVAQNSASIINQQIAREIESRIRYYTAHREQIDERLTELDADWDIERTLETDSATLALAGTLLGAFVNKRFLILPPL